MLNTCIFALMNVQEIDKQSNSVVLAKQEINHSMKEEHKKDTQDKVTLNPKKQEEEQKDVRKLTLIAVGDNLIHIPIIRSGRQKDGSYDFTHLFEGIKDEIKGADLAMINQETILCDSSLGYSGYPRFGSPYAIGEAIYQAGFDVVLQATNHANDKGIEGIKDTLDFWKQYQSDIFMVGLNESKDTSSRVVFIEKNDIKLAILNYTYGLNGLSLPQGKEYMVNLLTDQKQMKKDIAYAKENSDFVIVCPHWGTEYVFEPTIQQKDLTQFFLKEGVDLVIGTHPHVLEPVEWVESEDGKHKMLVFYSLGNFVSNQDAMARILGGMAKVTIVKDKNEVSIDQATIEPLVTHTYYDGKKRFVTYLLEDYTKSMAQDHTMNGKKKDNITRKKLIELSENILGDWYVAKE